MFCAVRLSAADEPAQNAQPQLSEAAMQELFAKLAQPGPQHEHFKAMVGRWNCECRNYEGDPNKPAMWKAKSEFELLLGGRYLQQELSGEMPGGIKYAGQGLSAYDNAQQKYVGTWVDNMGTGILHTEGSLDPATNVMTEMGVARLPVGEMKFKMVTTFKSDDLFHFAMWMVTPAGEQKMMEIDYHRAE
jgi:hypothetical protein